MARKTLRAWGWVLGLVAATLIAGTALAAESTLDVVKKRGKLVAGVRGDYPPIGFVNKEGKPAGFGVEIAKAFAKKLGVEVEFVAVASKTRIPLLLNGNIDCEVGVTTITKEREEVIDFSIVYLWDAGTIVVRKGTGIKSIKDLAAPKVAATTQGSLFVDLWKEHHGTAPIRQFQDFTEAVLALKQKKVDGVLINRLSGGAFVAQDPNLEMGEDFFRDPMGIGVRQNDSKWRNWVNWTLQELWKDGTFQRLFKQEVGIEPNWKLWSEYRLQPGI